MQAAWGAARKKNSYFQAQFLRLKARHGAKKAAIAVAASILTTVYHMLRDGTCYQDLGPEYFTRRNPAPPLRKLATASEISVIMLKSELPHEPPDPVSKKKARVHHAARRRGGCMAGLGAGAATNSRPT